VNHLSELPDSSEHVLCCVPNSFDRNPINAWHGFEIRDWINAVPVTTEARHVLCYASLRGRYVWNPKVRIRQKATIVAAAKDAYSRNTQRGGEVHRSSIITDEQSAVPNYEY
jgi:hypothetical protein